MRLSHSLVALVVAGAGALALAAPDDAEPLLIDVSDFANTSVGVPSDFSVGSLFPHVHGAEAETAAAELEQEPEDPASAAGELASLVRSFTEQADESSDVTAEPGMLVVRGNAAARERAQAVVAVLRRARGTPLRIDAEWLRLPPGSEVPSSPDAAALDRLRRLDDAGGAHALTVVTPAARWAAVTALREMSYIADVDVEIAQAAQVADPVVGVLQPGVTALLRPVPLSDGRVLVRVRAARSDLLAPLRRLSLGLEKLGALELADIDAMSVSTDVVLAPRTATTLVLGRPGGSVHVLVLRLADPPTPVLEGTLRTVPVGAYGDDEGDPQLSATRNDGSFVRLWGVGVRSPETAWDRSVVIDAALSPVRDEVDEGSIYATTLDRLLGGALVVSGPAERLDGIVARVRRFERELLRPVAVNVRLEEREGDAPARRIGELRGTLLEGRFAQFAAYRDASRVIDYDVEVAEKAQIADPIVRGVLAGLAANLRAVPTEGGWTVDVDLFAATLDAPEGIVSGAVDLGTIERVGLAVRRATTSLHVPSGGKAELALGTSPFSQNPARLVAVVEVVR